MFRSMGRSRWAAEHAFFAGLCTLLQQVGARDTVALASWSPVNLGLARQSIESGKACCCLLPSVAENLCPPFLTVLSPAFSSWPCLWPQVAFQRQCVGQRAFRNHRHKSDRSGRLARGSPLMVARWPPGHQQENPVDVGVKSTACHRDLAGRKEWNTAT